MEIIERLLPGISEVELESLIGSVKSFMGVRKVKINEDFVQILFDYNKRRGEYLSPSVYTRLSKYAGKVVYIIDYADDIFILDDNNVTICSYCFEEI